MMTFDAPIRGLLINHAKAMFPNEACALVFRNLGVLTQVHFVKNISETPEQAYEMCPTELGALFKYADSVGAILVGVFHSHPKGPAQMSERDLELDFYWNAQQAIYSVEQDAFNVFEHRDGQRVLIASH